MSSAALRQAPSFDVDEFLAFLDARPGERWELDAGVPRAMVGGTYAHASIGGNIIAALRSPAQRRGCNALGGFLVAIDDTSAFEPDAIILCEPPHRESRRTDRPVAVFEVLSRSTMDFDRSVKARRYRSLPSLTQLVFVYQDSLRVESWLRQDDTWPTGPEVLLRAERSLAIPCIGGSLALADIYAGIEPSPMLD